MTLIYRWGDVQPCKNDYTKHATKISGHQNGRAPNHVSTRSDHHSELDVRFLWIDSLCIVRDDPSDWELEASKMASIYSASYLTIAAVSSFNGNGGSEVLLLDILLLNHLVCLAD
jgi:hypothetical protein